MPARAGCGCLLLMLGDHVPRNTLGLSGLEEKGKASLRADGFLLGKAPLFLVFIADCIHTLCPLVLPHLTRPPCVLTFGASQAMEHLEDRARLQAQALALQTHSSSS